MCGLFSLEMSLILVEITCTLYLVETGRMQPKGPGNTVFIFLMMVVLLITTLLLLIIILRTVLALVASNTGPVTGHYHLDIEEMRPLEPTYGP